MLPAGAFSGTETTGFEQRGEEEEGEEIRRRTKKPQWVKQSLALGRFIPQFYKRARNAVWELKVLFPGDIPSRFLSRTLAEQNKLSSVASFYELTASLTTAAGLF